MQESGPLSKNNLGARAEVTSLTGIPAPVMPMDYHILVKR
jgi:hypothetical protein